MLLTVLGDDGEATKRARREIGYDKLVVFTDDPDARGVEDIRRLESFTGDEVQVVPVDPADLRRTLEAMDGVLRDHEADDVRFQVNAGDNRLTHPAILACFLHGVDAWFCTEARTQRLPVLQRSRLEERFSADERAVLRVLDGLAPVSAVVERAGLPREQVLGALLSLRKKGLVSVNGGQTVALNDGGVYYRDHLVASEA